jgi:hypothetical protein
MFLPGWRFAKGLNMSHTNIIAPCLTTALITAYATTWFLNSSSIEHPVVTVPPLLIEHEAGRLMAIGGWATTHGYAQPGRSAVEIRCYRDRQLCTEALANVHHHDEGADLEAETYLYTVTDWTAERLHATASMAEGCLDRRLLLYLDEPGGMLEWEPTDDCDEGYLGSAVLVGDDV